MGLIKCQDCGREISDQAASCIGCGRPMAVPATPAPPLVAVQPSEPKPEPTGNACTQCGSSETQRVSLAYELGTSSGWQAGVGVGASRGTGIIGGLTGGVGASSTELAKRLAPPSEPEAPEDPQGCGWFALVAMLGFLGFAAIILFIEIGFYPEVEIRNEGDAAARNAAPPVALLLYLIGFCLAWRRSHNKNERKMAPARERHQHQMVRHAEAVERWKRQFICLSCNAIFEPKSDTPANQPFDSDFWPTD